MRWHDGRILCRLRLVNFTLVSACYTPPDIEQDHDRVQILSGSSSSGFASPYRSRLLELGFVVRSCTYPLFLGGYYPTGLLDLPNVAHTSKQPIYNT